MPHWLSTLITTPLTALTASGSRFFLPYLVVSALIALAVLNRRHDSWGKAGASLFRRDVFLHSSAKADYAVAVINTLVALFLLGALVPGVAEVARFVQSALDFSVGVSGATPGIAGSLAFAFAALVSYDLANWVQHWLHHRVPFLWELHKVHHSAEVLTPLTALRLHPLSILVTGTIFALVFGAVDGVFLHVYPSGIAPVTLLGANLFFALHYSVGAYHLQHSHVWLSFPGALRRLLISPAVHRVHHSNSPAHYGKNFGFVFTIWDRMAGSLYIPDDSEEHSITIGLEASEQESFRSVFQLYVTPLRNIAGLAIEGLKPHSNPTG